MSSEHVYTSEHFLYDTSDAYYALIAVSSALSAVVAVQFIALLYFICVVEQRSRATESMATPFNFLLVFMALPLFFLAVLEIFCIRFVQQDDLRYYDVLRLAQYIFITACQASYIHYSWLRSRDIVRQMFPRLKTFAHYYVYTHITCTLFQSLPQLAGLLVPTLAAHLYNFSHFFTIGVTFANIAFELFLLVLFITYLRHLREGHSASQHLVSDAETPADGIRTEVQRVLLSDVESAHQVVTSQMNMANADKVDPKRRSTRWKLDPSLVIIARFGLVSLTFGLFIVGFVVAWMFTYERYFVIVLIFTDGIFCSLFAMKVALWRQKQSRAASFGQRHTR
ncbi:hypothetical protein BJ741DRAFT_234167 [Chytriomyces cf. hyalinus JEL632]|nr:hypothetical protein BJ741DRAFT_234167 [Chytriomyces cf. hyalinus JEL632]